MFTLPEARGRGIAKALIHRVITEGSAEAAKVGLPFAASMVVEKDNPVARGLYEKCGFVAIGEEPFTNDPVSGRPRIAVLMIYVSELMG
jgi:ribosomal protein S18 acetylase RimI-like enzyme